MESWLITGGAGFIGSNLVRLVLAERPDVHVVVLDKLTYAGRRENLADLPAPERFLLLEGDIARAADVEAALAAHSPTCILNLAAETHVDRTIDGPRTCIETNLRGTFELLEAARGQQARVDAERRARFRFLQVSTDEVFGSLGPEGRFDEETRYAPTSPYSASKAGADFLVHAYHRTYGLPTIVTNCSNNYGPRQLPEKLIPLMILNALDGRALPIYGDGRNVRDWIYVEDHCRGILRALEAGTPGEQYVFGADCERSNLELVEALCAALERLRPARDNAALVRRGVRDYSRLKRFVADRPGHDFRYAIDARKARRELGWRPLLRFDEALEQTVAWYLENESWRRAVEAEGSLRERQGLDRIDHDDPSGPSGPSEPIGAVASREGVRGARRSAGTAR